MNEIKEESLRAVADEFMDVMREMVDNLVILNDVKGLQRLVTAVKKYYQKEKISKKKRE